MQTQQLKPESPAIIFTRHASKYWLRVRFTRLAGWAYFSSAVVHYCWSILQLGCCSLLLEHTSAPLLFIIVGAIMCETGIFVWRLHYGLDPWLHPSGDKTKCADLAPVPPLASSLPFLPSPSFCTSLCPHLTTTTDFPFQHSSFELHWFTCLSTVCPLTERIIYWTKCHSVFM